MLFRSLILVAFAACQRQLPVEERSDLSFTLRAEPGSAGVAGVPGVSGVSGGKPLAVMCTDCADDASIVDVERSVQVSHCVSGTAAYFPPNGATGDGVTHVDAGNASVWPSIFFGAKGDAIPPPPVGPTNARAFFLCQFVVPRDYKAGSAMTMDMQVYAHGSAQNDIQMSTYMRCLPDGDVTQDAKFLVEATPEAPAMVSCASTQGRACRREVGGVLGGEAAAGSTCLLLARRTELGTSAPPPNAINEAWVLNTTVYYTAVR